MYAIIKTGGKQYRVAPEDVLDIEKLNVEAGDQVDFDEVLAVGDDDNFTIGLPLVDGAKVKAEVVEHGLDDDILVFKYKSKKDYRKHQHHRQPYTRVKILDIVTE